jgi:hypothetical protein
MSLRIVWALVVAIVALGVARIGFGVGGKDEQQLNFRLESFNVGLDPAFLSDTQSRRLVDMLHAKLLTMDEKGNVAGEIADQWTWTNDTTLRVRLRSGLTFSNKSAVTSSDVVYSLCRLLQPGAPYGWLFSNIRHTAGATGQAAQCGGLKALDPLNLEIEVTSDPARLVPALATSAAAIIPANAVPGEYKSVPGAGPYEIDEIVANARVVLKARSGGALAPKSKRAVFQLVQDDAAAATLFKAGKLDAIEIGNPILRGLLVSDRGALAVPGRLVETDAHQVRLLIVNNAGIAKSLGVDESQAGQFARGFTETVDVNAIAGKFPSLAIPMQTSYFPARAYAKRPKLGEVAPVLQGRIQVISENDPYSDAIASLLPSRIGGVEISKVGLEKSVLISRLLSKDYDIASITLEAVMNHPAYWLAFFQPGAPFTVFGKGLEGLQVDKADEAINRVNAEIIDTKGNWLGLFQERRLMALQPKVTGETFLQTGLVNFATIGVVP